MDHYIRKKCVTCDGEGMMKVLDPAYLRDEKEEYTKTAGNSPAEILRKVRYILNTPEGSDIQNWARRVWDKVPKFYQKYPHKL